MSTIHTIHEVDEVIFESNGIVHPFCSRGCMDDDGGSIPPGSPGFREMWEKYLNDREEETLEAYFPDLCEGD